MSLKKEINKCQKAEKMSKQAIKILNEQIAKEYERHEKTMNELLSAKRRHEINYSVLNRELTKLINEEAKRESVPEETE